MSHSWVTLEWPVIVLRALSKVLPRWGDGSWAKKEKNKKSFWYPTQNKKPSPGRTAQTPRAGTSDYAGRSRRYWCSTPFNYTSNLSTCDTFLRRLIPSLDNCRLLPTPEETPNLNLRAVPLKFLSFCTPTKIVVPKKYTLRFGSIPSPRWCWCVRCLLITERPKTPCHYRYQI